MAPLTTAHGAVDNSTVPRMAESGLIELGAHTHTHANFKGNPGAFEPDLRKCMALLQDRFGVAEATFAFPFGTSSLLVIKAMSSSTRQSSWTYFAH
jgi:hypothetical protein